MVKGDDHAEIDRGMALHKMIRLLTLSTGGEGYLTFMGNEFGHPEWVDFPREGNGGSYQYARRQWSLADNPELKYGELEAFDRALMEIAGDVLPSPGAQLLNIDQANQCLQFERANFLFAFNFSPTKSVADYEFPVPKTTAGDYRLILSTDDPEFGGHGRTDSSMLPARTALVFKK